jgi:hypothetical protein
LKIKQVFFKKINRHWGDSALHGAAFFISSARQIGTGGGIIRAEAKGFLAWMKSMDNKSAEKP